MVKKLKALAKARAIANWSATIRNSANQIWLAGLGAFAKAQEEGGKIFEALVKEGEAVQDRAKKVADDKFTDVKAKATGNGTSSNRCSRTASRARCTASACQASTISTHLSTRVHELTARPRSSPPIERHPARRRPQVSRNRRAPLRSFLAGATREGGPPLMIFGACFRGEVVHERTIEAVSRWPAAARSARSMRSARWRRSTRR